MDKPSFRYPETVRVLESLYAQNSNAAEVAAAVEPSRWHTRYLQHLPLGVSAQIYADVDGGISRAMLRELAARSRARPDDDRCLSDLFFNILAWGISGDWRRVGAITTEFAARPQKVIRGLRAARDASFASQLREAYDEVDHLLPKWGPAFMTKFLAFTANPANDDKAKAITVDSRVQLAWQILIGPEGAWSLTAKRYAVLCERAQTLASETGWTPDDLEQRLFIFGQNVGSYANWADAELRAIRGQAPTIPAAEVVAQLEAAAK